MGKTGVLNQAAADLARGLTHPAIQRLSSLVAAYPQDLDLRRRLAAAYRRVGNRVQAGRWDYLTLGADPQDTYAFERAYPSALSRLYQLNWPYRPAEAATQYARDRLGQLAADAAAEFDRLTATRAMRVSRDRPLDRPARERGSGPAGWLDRAARWLRIAGPLSTAPGRPLLVRLLTGRSGRRTVLTGAVATVAAAPFAVVGVVTTVGWILH